MIWLSSFPLKLVLPFHCPHAHSWQSAIPPQSFQHCDVMGAALSDSCEVTEDSVMRLVREFPISWWERVRRLETRCH